MYLEVESGRESAMADQALQNAQSQRKAISAELEATAKEVDRLLLEHQKLRVKLAEVERFIRQWHEMAGLKPPSDLAPRQAPAQGGKRVRPRNPDKEEVAKRCVSYIRGAKRPLMRKELMERLKQDRVEIRGTDPLMVLSTMLWRSKKIVMRLPGGGYWPTYDPLPDEVPEPGKLPDLL
jgi:hypothetical protein